jgi:hypothetical protein
VVPDGGVDGRFPDRVAQLRPCLTERVQRPCLLYHEALRAELRVGGVQDGYCHVDLARVVGARPQVCIGEVEPAHRGFPRRTDTAEDVSGPGEGCDRPAHVAGAGAPAPPEVGVAQTHQPCREVVGRVVLVEALQRALDRRDRDVHIVVDAAFATHQVCGSEVA